MSGKLGWPELSSRHLPGDRADCTSFLMGDNVIEAMQPAAQDSPTWRGTAGMFRGSICLTFQVRSAASAADYLRSKGFELVGDPATRFAINPDQAFGRLIYFTDKRSEGYPALGTMLGPAGTPS